MGILDKLVDVTKPIDAIGKIIDDVYTSDEEMLDKKILMQRIATAPALAQTEINRIEAGHRNVFVAGWRPAIGWTCALGLFYAFIVGPTLEAFGLPPVEIPTAIMMELVLALLGLGALRTYEKVKGVSR